MKIIDEVAGIERDEDLRGMVFKLADNEHTWGKFKQNELFISDRFLRHIFNMATFKGFWEEK